MHLRTVVGEVELQVWYGYAPGTRRWGSPNAEAVFWREGMEDWRSVQELRDWK